MTFLYLVRHGETDWNLARKIQGVTDIPLNDTGRQQALRTAEILARRKWDLVAASPLGRAAETGSIIAARLSLPEPIALPAVSERNYGEGEGLTGAELSLKFPDGSPVPRRESRAAVAARVIPALVNLARARPGQAIVVVTHGGVIRTVLHEIEPVDSPHHSAAITNGSIHSFEYVDEGLVLIAFDDPMEYESANYGSADLIQQNAIESREE